MISGKFGMANSVLFVAWLASLIGTWRVFQDGEVGDPSRVILATVDGVPIDAARVNYTIRLALGPRLLDDSLQRRLVRETLEYLIDQQLIFRKLEEQQQSAGSNEIQLELDLLSEELARLGRTLDEHWKQLGTTESAWRAETAWRLSWRRYVDAYFTDERLEAFYEAHRREFDGTKLRVAQILLAPPSPEDAPDEALRQAENIRRDILNGQMTWEEAVARFSVAPSRSVAGDLGWIEMRRPMPEQFSKAAFRLEPGEISAPFISSYGIHLIRCLEVHPGKFLFRDVRDDVRRAAIEARFRELADELRLRASIIYH